MRGFSLQIALRVLVLSLILGWTRAAVGTDPFTPETSAVRTNYRYVVYAQDAEHIEVFDLSRNEARMVTLPRSIEHIEICPTNPYASIITRAQDVGSSRRFFILDLETMGLFGDNFYLDPGEKRWSPLGTYTYFNHMQSFVLVETSMLREYLGATRKAEKPGEIEGHPLGLVWQVSWLGDRLLYGTGIEGMVCWGIYEPQRKSNGFVGCCREGESDACNQVRDDEVVRRFVTATARNEIKPMTHGLYRYVLEQQELKGRGK